MLVPFQRAPRYSPKNQALRSAQCAGIFQTGNGAGLFAIPMQIKRSALGPITTTTSAELRVKCDAAWGDWVAAPGAAAVPISFAVHLKHPPFLFGEE